MQAICQKLFVFRKAQAWKFFNLEMISSEIKKDTGLKKNR